MVDSYSERRLVENEAIFKQINNDVKDFVLEDAPFSEYAKKELNFYCECSDINCRERIRLTAQTYEDLHENKKQFIIKNGHEIPEIEKIIRESNGYLIVEKLKVPPEAGEFEYARFA